MELTQGEEFFISVNRNFDFLRFIYYDGSKFCCIGKEIWVSFYNPRTCIEITVIMEEPYVLNVYFKRKKFLTILKFTLRDYYKKLGVGYLEKTNDVKTVACFIHENLMPIVEGEKWIDDFLATE